MTPERKAEDTLPAASEIESRLWAGDQANTPDEEAAVHELHRQRVEIGRLLATIDTLERQAADEYKHGLEDAAGKHKPPCPTTVVTCDYLSEQYETND